LSLSNVRELRSCAGSGEEKQAGYRVGFLAHDQHHERVPGNSRSAGTGRHRVEVPLIIGGGAIDHVFASQRENMRYARDPGGLVKVLDAIARAKGK
jgi:hypothetical protein